MKEQPETPAPQLLLENQLCFPLYACGRRIVSLYTPYFKSLDLTYTQYVVFLALWEKDNQTVGELGRRLYLDNGTLTPLLKKMENAGWIRRRRSQEDERVVTISLTDSGRDMRGKVKDIPCCVSEMLSLTEDEADTLRGLLHKLLTRLSEE